jgi:TolA-binding protein
MAAVVCAQLIVAQDAAAQQAARPKDGGSASVLPPREVPRGGMEPGEDRYQALGAEILRLNDRLAALERMTVQVVSRQEDESRSLAQLRDEIGRFRTDVERQLAGMAASYAPNPNQASRSEVPRPITSTSAIDRFEQGKAFALSGEWSNAELAFTAFISNNPTDPRIAEARYRLGLAYLEQGQPAQGARIFIELFDSGASAGFEPDNLFALARALEKMKHVDPVQVCSVYAEIEVAHGPKLSTAQREELLDLRLNRNCGS